MRLPLVRPLVEMRGCALQPRLVPCLGIEPETFWFTDQRSIHRATLARAQWGGFKRCFKYCISWDWKWRLLHVDPSPWLLILGYTCEHWPFITKRGWWVLRCTAQEQGIFIFLQSSILKRCRKGRSQTEEMMFPEGKSWILIKYCNKLSKAEKHLF